VDDLFNKTNLKLFKDFRPHEQLFFLSKYKPYIYYYYYMKFCFVNKLFKPYYKGTFIYLKILLIKF